MKIKLTRIIIIAVIAAVVFFIGWRIANRIIQSGKKPSVIVYTVGALILKKQTVTETLFYQGIVQGDPEVKVYPQVTGIFSRNLVQEGAFVHKDQTIALIDRNIPGEDYKLATVQSPIPGIVTKLYYIDKGASVTLDRPVADVADINNIKVVINVGETDLLKIKKGMPALIYSLSDSARFLNASVYSVTPVVDQDTFSGSITIKSPNKKNVFESGMSAGVNISIGKIEAFMVPQEAVIMGQNKVYVFINSNGKAKEVDVTQGYATSNTVEIKGDIHEGDEVITEGSFKLYDGAAVRAAL